MGAGEVWSGELSTSQKANNVSEAVELVVLRTICYCFPYTFTCICTYVYMYMYIYIIPLKKKKHIPLVQAPVRSGFWALLL